ncbi:MAG: hypothetical protein KF855_08900 [Acidobacteria bacterium]|nr:hypothetical protein [Acidobacteriota bacterium]
MRNAVFLLIAVGFLAVNASAQSTKTITNLDLEKYRQARLAAEKDLRENYERLGFPSPEEMEKQQEKERLDRERLSERLRAERLYREQTEAANNSAPVQDQVVIAPVPQYSNGGASVFYTGPYNRRYGRGYYPRYNYPIQGYRATPVGVYPVPLPQPPPRPAFRPHRPRR